jgi:hypothetical protein
MITEFFGDGDKRDRTADLLNAMALFGSPLCFVLYIWSNYSRLFDQ